VGAEDVETQKGGFCVSETVTVASLAEKLRNRPKPMEKFEGIQQVYATNEVGNYFEELERDVARLQKQLVSGTAFRTLLAELEDQKYEVSENSGLFVVDFVDVLKAIGNFKEQILGGEAEK
jgi:hypothetical protein